MEQDTEKQNEKQHNRQIIKNHSKITQRTQEFLKKGHVKLDYNSV